VVWTRECGLGNDETQDLLVSTSLWNDDCKLTLKRDAFTTTSDFIISPHSASKGLYIATCGSFHGYKFFPVLGKYITQMLEGELSPELVERWAWDRQRSDSSQNVEYPNSEMKHLLEPAAKL
jgi:hypothetical protein